MFSKLKTLTNGQILFALLAGDLLFIFMHILHEAPNELIPVFSSNAFLISKDNSIGEGFQYAKEYWIMLAFFLLAFRYRKFAYLGWGVLFTYILVDDVIRIHEPAGELLGTVLSGMEFFRSRPELPLPIGELTFFASLGLLLVILLSIPYLRSDRETKRVYHHLFLMILVFAFFGGVVDFLYLLVNPGQIGQKLFKLIEDGGEMIVMSVICWYAYSLFLKIQSETAKINPP
jgi:hypothetical protein